jgi:CRISPR/Cas system-associated exonuclease Cas4 (RecB family)
MKDKYSAVWVSHSSIADFLKCPRLYYLRNVYKDPATRHKITIMTPALALGQAVHDTLEDLSNLPVQERLSTPLSEDFKKKWQNVSGKRGGFKTKELEDAYFERGLEMLRTVEKNPGPILNKAVKIPQELPFYWLSEADNIILCGKIDWLEYMEDIDGVHVLDFKTGRIEEPEDSLQLPIYHLLVANTQKRRVDKASYWYLDSADTPNEQSLPDLGQAYGKVYDVAKRMKLARQLDHFKCPEGGCRYCLPFEQVLKGKGELVGQSSYHQDIYVL